MSAKEKSPNPQVPLILGRYRLLDRGLLGEGGWCTVRQAEDVETGKGVAIKTFREQVVREVGHAKLEQRFLHEVEIFRRLGASLQHASPPSSPREGGVLAAGSPALWRRQKTSVSVLDPCHCFVNLLNFSPLGAACEDVWADGGCFTVLEMAEESLGGFLSRRSCGPDFIGACGVRELALALAAGLSWLHSKNLCHLDLKPANIMRFGDRWKIIDLEGCAPAGAEGAPLSLECITPLYASPELARGALACAQEAVAPTRRVLEGMAPAGAMDVWSVGVLLLDTLVHACALEDIMSGCQAATCFEDAEGNGFLQAWEEEFYRFLADPTPLDPFDLVRAPASSVELLESDAGLVELLQGLLAKVPSERLSAHAFQQHAWLRPPSPSLSPMSPQLRSNTEPEAERPPSPFLQHDRQDSETQVQVEPEVEQSPLPATAPQRSRRQGNAQLEARRREPSRREVAAAAPAVMECFEALDVGRSGSVPRSFVESLLCLMDATLTAQRASDLIDAAGFQADASMIDYRQFLRWTFSGQALGSAAGQRRRKLGRAERIRRRRAKARLLGGSGDSPRHDAVGRKKLERVAREGGKRGVEIEGAADLGGLQFFCTCVRQPDGNIELLLESLRAMNAEAPTGSIEERTGGSGHIGKMLFSAGRDQLAIVAFVPEARRQDLCCADWLQAVLRVHDGEMVSAEASICTGIVKANAEEDIFPLKIREAMIIEANNFLRARKLFPEDVDADDDDDFLYGDDDFPD